MSATHECPLCHGPGESIDSFRGAYDQDVSHLTFDRLFYRCTSPGCRAVFFFDELIKQEADPNWEAEREEEIHAAESRRMEMQDSDVYQNMMRAREENDTLITKDRDLMKQVKEIENKIAKEQEELESFPDRMRNFQWEEPARIEEWVSSQWLPPSFAEKSVATTFGMSRPAIRKDIPEAERAQWRDDGPTYKEGQTVIHKAWGQGKVIEGNDDGGTIITAEFPKQGKKKMDLRFAKLERAS